MRVGGLWEIVGRAADDSPYVELLVHFSKYILLVLYIQMRG